MTDRACEADDLLPYIACDAVDRHGGFCHLGEQRAGEHAVLYRVVGAQLIEGLLIGSCRKDDHLAIGSSGR